MISDEKVEKLKAKLLDLFIQAECDCEREYYAKLINTIENNRLMEKMKR